MPVISQSTSGASLFQLRTMLAASTDPEMRAEIERELENRHRDNLRQERLP